MKQILLAISFFGGIHTFAQDGKIAGKVTDEKGEGIISANIIIDASKGQAVVSDFDGNYELSVPEGSYDVHYRYVGKDEVVEKIKVVAGTTVTKNIVLKEKEHWKTCASAMNATNLSIKLPLMLPGNMILKQTSANGAKDL